MQKLPWIVKIIIMCVCTVTAGIVPAILMLWANYEFDPTVYWTNVYGGWFIVPMVVVCTMWAGLVLDYVEKRLKVCSHKW